ncbi:hypothetical protein [Streptomyces sp. NRRL F-5135]|uniref:hypothetical protein n=1 Tax=Streptomyces sp. NRRL F-5135 TaxID=1463858 RepID=UPI000690C049|nr:hypothetical protein [Streptomyces sp. NRRL F-5135]
MGWGTGAGGDGGDGKHSGKKDPGGAKPSQDTKAPRPEPRIYRDVVREEHVPAESSTAVSPWSVTGDAWAARFSIGLQLPDVWHAWHDNPDVPGVTSRLWLATTDAGSWAAVDWDGRTDERFTLWQHGPRRLWNEGETAHDRWRSAGEPRPGRYGMTVDTDGNHVAWLDDPDHPVAATV